MPDSLLRVLACGSVDDGKSTLIGRLLFECGTIPDDVMMALKRDSKRFGTVEGGIDYALLVEIFFTEVFAFLQNQFGAAFGLLFDLALLLTLRAMIHAEEHRALYGTHAPEASVDGLTPSVVTAS